MLSPIATRRARLLAAGAGVALALGLLAGPALAEVDEATSVTAPAPAYGAVEYEWTDPLRAAPCPSACTCPRQGSQAHVFRWWCFLMASADRVAATATSAATSRQRHRQPPCAARRQRSRDLDRQSVQPDRSPARRRAGTRSGQPRAGPALCAGPVAGGRPRIEGRHRADRRRRALVRPNTALLAAGARVERDGRVLEFRDHASAPRF